MQKQLLLLALLLLSACGSPTLTSTGSPEIHVEVEQEASQEAIMNPGTGRPPKDALPEALKMERDEKTIIFNVTGEDFKFMMEGQESPELRVKEGETVVINFTSTDGFHDWVLDEFNAATAKIQTGKTSSVTFVAEKKGEFEYYCSIGNHAQQGMIGKLIVE